MPSSLLAFARAGLDRSINPYDYTQPCLHPPLCYDTSKVYKIIFQPFAATVFLCVIQIENFLNQEDVRKALGVDRSWSPCNPDVKQHVRFDNCGTRSRTYIYIHTSTSVVLSVNAL